MEALTDVPNPRKARGKQYPWTLLLTLVCSALFCGERSGHGIALSLPVKAMFCLGVFAFCSTAT
jgi:hypothetical protein